MMTDGSSRLDQRDLLHESGAEVPAPEVPHGLGTSNPTPRNAAHTKSPHQTRDETVLRLELATNEQHEQPAPTDDVADAVDGSDQEVWPGPCQPHRLLCEGRRCACRRRRWSSVPSSGLVATDTAGANRRRPDRPRS